MLALRLERAKCNAMALAELARHPNVTLTRYPDLAAARALKLDGFREGAIAILQQWRARAAAERYRPRVHPSPPTPDSALKINFAAKEAGMRAEFHAQITDDCRLTGKQLEQVAPCAYGEQFGNVDGSCALSDRTTFCERLRCREPQA